MTPYSAHGWSASLHIIVKHCTRNTTQHRTARNSMEHFVTAQNNSEEYGTARNSTEILFQPVKQALVSTTFLEQD